MNSNDVPLWLFDALGTPYYVMRPKIADADGWVRVERARQPSVPMKHPINMILFCPECFAQHVDAPDPAFSETAVSSERMARAIAEGFWTNPPHRSHLCHACGCVWRPADVPTNGVAKIETRGDRDTRSAVPRRLGAPRQLIVGEYRREMRAAEESAAIQIWASIQRRAGDPRWVWAGNEYGGTIEVMT